MLTFSRLAKGDHFRFCDPLSGEPYGYGHVKTSARWYYDFRNDRKFTTGGRVRVALIDPNDVNTSAEYCLPRLRIGAS